MNEIRERWIAGALAFFLFCNGLANVATALFLIFHLGQYIHVDQYAQDVVQHNKFQHGSDFIMLFLGIFLMKLGHGLFKQQRSSWFWAMAFVTLALMNSLVPPISLHLAIIGLIYLLILFGCRRHFYHIDLAAMSYQKAVAWLSVFFALAYGIGGSYFFRAEFNHINSWVDAFYYTIETYSTVGYGDIVPITSDAKIFTVSMILIGVVSFLTALSVLLGPLIQRNIKGVYKMVSSFSRLHGHILLCGDNVMTRELARLYIQEGKMCFFLEPNVVLANALEADQLPVIRINPENTESLKEVKLNKAACLIAAYDDDAKNILIVISARSIDEGNLDHHCRIIARIEALHNIEKAKRAGATEVISPLKMSADWLIKQGV
ncbi:MAG: NAD-binding protein [Gammaproteobacteria bacterium]|nr:NAD-binding protein [Gammaproteobacteria bacterium]